MYSMPSSTCLLPRSRATFRDTPPFFLRGLHGTPDAEDGFTRSIVRALPFVRPATDVKYHPPHKKPNDSVIGSETQKNSITQSHLMKQTYGKLR